VHSFGSEPTNNLGIFPGSTPNLSDSPSAHLICIGVEFCIERNYKYTESNN